MCAAAGREGGVSMWLAVLCVLCLLPGGGLALPLPWEAGGLSEPQWKQAQVGPCLLPGGSQVSSAARGSVFFNWDSFSDDIKYWF